MVLPQPPALFMGRDRELTALRAEIDRPGLVPRGGVPARQSRVLLIAGGPGSGRTSVALHLAHQLTRGYPDGQFFARLTAPGGQPVPVEDVAHRFLEALGVGPLPPPSWAEGQPIASPEPEPRPGRRRSAAGEKPTGASERTRDLPVALCAALMGRRVLLVFDDVANSGQLLPLLPDTPGCLVIATARGPLTEVADARPCVLGGLEPAVALEILTHTLGPTRIACDPRAAELLAQECGGHPTALRLAAGALAAQPQMSFAVAAGRLRRFAEDEKAAPSPTGVVGRAFRLLHGGLPPAVSRTLRLLVLAPAGAIDAHTASALAGCSLQAARSALDGLADHGALLREGTDDYRVPGCLESELRGLLADKERPGEIQLAQARMLERTVRLLGACLAALQHTGRDPMELPDLGRAGTNPERAPDSGASAEPETGCRDGGQSWFPSAGEASQWLRERRPALLAACQAAARDGELDNLARRLITAFVQVLSFGGSAGGGASPSELYLLHGMVLAMARRQGLPREQAAALINLADLDAGAGRHRQALDRYREALTCARAVEDAAATARALESMGDAHSALGDFPRALDWYGRALTVRETRGELSDQARLHGYLGATQVRLGGWDSAAREWRASAALHRRTGDIAAHARAVTETARVFEYMGQFEDALRICREALRWARYCGDARLEAAVLVRMADTLDRLGDPSGARVQREQAQALLTLERSSAS